MTPHRIRDWIGGPSRLRTSRRRFRRPRGAAGLEPAARARGPDRDQPRRQGRAGLAPVDGRDLLRGVPRDLGRRDHRPRHAPPAYSATTFTDTTVTNGTTYFYEVRASADGAQSGAAQRATATPRGASCSTGNRIVVENCFPGTTGVEGARRQQRVPDTASRASCRRPASTPAAASTCASRPAAGTCPTTSRSTARATTAARRAASCRRSPASTGEHGYCDTSARHHRPRRLHRHEPRGDDHHDRRLGLRRLPAQARPRRQRRVQRGDPRRARRRRHVRRAVRRADDHLPGLQRATAASRSTATTATRRPRCPTETRAVEVSFDRPYAQPTGNATATTGTRAPTSRTVVVARAPGLRHDATSRREDLHTDGAQLTHHNVFISRRPRRVLVAGDVRRRQGGAQRRHVRDLLRRQRRLLARALRSRARCPGVANRVMVAYKTIESGPADPSGISTSTFRDPAGPNQPENAADRPDVHRRQARGRLPAACVRGGGQEPPLALHRAERPGAGRDAPRSAPGSSAGSGTRAFDNGLEPAGVQTLVDLARGGQRAPGQRRTRTRARQRAVERDDLQGRERRARCSRPAPTTGGAGSASNMHGDGRARQPRSSRRR